MNGYGFNHSTECPTVLTVAELSRLLRVGINNAYQLVRDGTIQSVRVGRQYRIPRSAVLDYLGHTNSDNRIC